MTENALHHSRVETLKYLSMGAVLIVAISIWYYLGNPAFAVILSASLLTGINRICQQVEKGDKPESFLSLLAALSLLLLIFWALALHRINLQV
jgi:hypothetical protein